MNEQQDTSTIEVKVWMVRNGLNMSRVARMYGCGRAMVHQLIQGQKTSKGLVDFMVNLGCPAEYFDGGRIAGASEGEKNYEHA
jgi:hypothetical protein